MREEPQNEPSAHPRASHAMLLMVTVMALIILMGQPLQEMDTISGILITEWALICLPVWLMLRWARLDARTALGFRCTGPLVFAGAVVAGLSAWYLVGVLVETLQQRFMPVPPEMIESFRRAILDPGRPLILDLFALALSPAICEEILFRGVILRATRPTMSALSAILLNGLLFGLFHMNPYKIFPTMLLGLILALITLRSGSILPAMLFHFVNNACALVGGRLFGDVQVEGAPHLVRIPLAVGSLALFVLGIFLIFRGRFRARAAPADLPGPEG